MSEPETRLPKVVHLYLLAHHHEADVSRCILIGGRSRKLAVCGRCLGMYPALLATLVLQWVVAPLGPPQRAFDWLVLVLAAPGLAHWGLERLRMPGRKAVRVLTGALLGVALGRALQLYFRDPYAEVFWVLAVLVVAGAAAFEAVRALRL